MAARTLVFTLAGAAAPAPAVRIDQHFAHGVLAVVPPGGCLRRRIPLPPASLATAVRARLKLVVADQDEGCSLSLNGTPLPMPPRGTWTTRQEIPPDRLGQANELVFSAGERPLRVLMASIELISDG